MLHDVKELLHRAAYLPAELARVLDGPRPVFVKFDPELGYLPADYSLPDGLDNALTECTYDPQGGFRRMIHYGDRPCRINTYGNSFTQCAQVNDGETWQEVLAAHFREPIRNLGVGGYGVYQAYRRAMRVEATELEAKYLILNIWEDDHLRSLDSSRWIRVAWIHRALPRGGGPDDYPAQAFPWSHLRYDLENRECVERPGLCRSEEDLRRLTNRDYYYEAFKDDPVVHLFTLREGGEAPVEHLEKLAEAFELAVDLRNPETRRADARLLHLTYGIRATQFVLDRFRRWAEQKGRKLMVLLSYDTPTVKSFIETGERFDGGLIEYLEAKHIHHVDGLSEAAEEYKAFRMPVDAFLNRFYIARAGAQVFGHYAPYGNFWFAFAIRNQVLGWLDPKPPAYK